MKVKLHSSTPLTQPTALIRASLPDETCLRVCHRSGAVFVREEALMTIPMSGTLIKEGWASDRFPQLCSKPQLSASPGSLEKLPRPKAHLFELRKKNKRDNKDEQNVLKEKTGWFHLKEQSFQGSKRDSELCSSTLQAAGGALVSTS